MRCGDFPLAGSDGSSQQHLS